MQSSHANEHDEQEPPPDAQQDLADQLAATEDRFKRALADLDNYRKRAGRETDRRVAEAREALLRDWLEALDSVERAIALDPALAEGLTAVLQQMEAILELRVAGLEVGDRRLLHLGLRVAVTHG